MRALSHSGAALSPAGKGSPDGLRHIAWSANTQSWLRVRPGGCGHTLVLALRQGEFGLVEWRICTNHDEIQKRIMVRAGHQLHRSIESGWLDGKGVHEKPMVK